MDKRSLFLYFITVFISRLCYIEAVIMEVQRIVNVAPMTAAHRSKTDATVQEFVIPQVENYY